MKKFMIFVIDDLSGLGTPEEMQAIEGLQQKSRITPTSLKLLSLDCIMDVLR